MKNWYLIFVILALVEFSAAGKPNNILIENSYGCNSANNLAILDDSVKIDADCDGDLDSTALSDTSGAIDIRTISELSYSWLLTSQEDADSSIWNEEILCKNAEGNEFISPGKYQIKGYAVDSIFVSGGADAGIYKLRHAPCDIIKFVFKPNAASGASDTIFAQERILRLKD